MNLFTPKKAIRIVVLMFIPFGLSAHVQLDYPQGGETFYSGDSINIQWTEVIHHNTMNWELYYSADGGSTWQVIDDDIDYDLRTYKWEVPGQGTSMGRIKVVQNNEGTNYEDESDNFTIMQPSGLISSEDKFLTSIKITPNPVQFQSYIQFTSPRNDQLTLEIYNVNGQKVKTYKNQNVEKGKNAIPINTDGLEPGIYICVLSTQQVAKSLKFMLSR